VQLNHTIVHVRTRDGADAREPDEVPDHVGLIEVPALDGKGRPRRRAPKAGDARFGAVKALQAGVEFRRQADLPLEDLDEATVAEPTRCLLTHAHSVSSKSELYSDGPAERLEVCIRSDRRRLLARSWWWRRLPVPRLRCRHLAPLPLQT